LNDKERGSEEFAARKNDQEMMARYQEAEKKRLDAEKKLEDFRLRNNNSTRKVPEVQFRAPEQYSREVSRSSSTVDDSRNAFITHAEFADFRKDTVRKIRDLEDDIEELKTEISRRR